MIAAIAVVTRITATIDRAWILYRFQLPLQEFLYLQRQNPRAIQCLQGQRLALAGIELLNNLQMSHCPDDTYICHRFDRTARQDGQTGKKTFHQ